MAKDNEINVKQQPEIGGLNGKWGGHEMQRLNAQASQPTTRAQMCKPLTRSRLPILSLGHLWALRLPKRYQGYAVSANSRCRRHLSV